ncbi:MAG: hypothetical protein CMG74_07770 [Candidatus Marinimicrobia bacterium]|nr:hypothetical protein [Candidatus Neomarinimicrobiota bacterium]
MDNLKYKTKSICTIVSHTDHYINKNGMVVGFGPTIEEIDYLSSIFSIVYHCAPLNKNKANASLIEYKSKNVRFKPLISGGGSTLTKKLRHIKYYFSNFRIIKSCLKKSNILHFRAPTGIGILFLPWVLFFWKRGIWIKYAGSWIDNSVPLTYRFQRWLLKRFPKRAIITINGNFECHRGNFVSLFNPCFSISTFKLATDIAKTKTFNGKLNLLFVGRLEKEKGLDDLLSIIEEIGESNEINSLTVIGESKTLSKYKNWADKLPLIITFPGILSRSEVFKYYEKSHIIILLSKTEGFPKVIIEAGAFGCVAITSDLPQIKETIKHEYNGFILKSEAGLKQYLNFQSILNNREKLKLCSKNINIVAQNFTFEKYISKLKNAFLHKIP